MTREFALFAIKRGWTRQNASQQLTSIVQFAYKTRLWLKMFHLMNKNTIS